ncbi:MAG: glutamate racemase [Fusobacteriaceae bacterium]|jgi:glutamate racemase|nr:glutamate racemase [Fusobacteriaceae bacterium]
MENERPIGLFDSGVGGLSVLKEVVKLLPRENIIYYGDSGNAPYGDREKEDIRRLCFGIMDFLVEQKCKVIVIACNTAVAAAYDEICEKYGFPTVDVVSSGARAAVKTSRNKKIGVLSTPFTAKSNIYAQKIESISPGASVYQEGCPEFVPMIERGWEMFSDRREIVSGHVRHLPEQTDVLVLGCTHYPIIRDDIEAVFDGFIVDPAVETAAALRKILREKQLLREGGKRGSVSYYVSGDIEIFREIANKFLGYSISGIQRKKVN